MELRWLHDFLAVAEARSFTKAAELRHTSQAALSRRIQQLEAWLGVRLINRGAYPSCLTAQGERFLEQAREMLRLAHESRDEAVKGSRPSSDFIRIALPLTMASYLLPQWWRGWYQGRTAPSCDISASNLHDAVTALVSDASDLLLSYSNPALPLNLGSDRFECLPLMKDTLRPYAAPRFLTQVGTKVDKAFEAHGANLLYSEGTYVEQLLKKIPEIKRLAPSTHPMVRSDLVIVLMQMALQGMGIAWLPGCVATALVLSGELVDLGGDRWSQELTYCAYRDADNRNPALRDLWKTIGSR